jgi:membrane protein implicated in regulation of membrane protease activity
MVSLWITIGLVIAATGVASLGAFFSITGLGALFSGAMLAVWLMAGSLEFAKFVLAAYLHQTWKNLNVVYRGYLTFAIVVLSIITSTGIYGFLSDAYQSASSVLESETVKLESIKTQQSLITTELTRLNKLIDEIPENRISRRMKMRAEIEPQIQELNKKYADGERILTQSNLKIIEVKKKVGPLIYIAKALNMNIDHVVSGLILVLVSVFDPLAICLVIAATHAIGSYRSESVKEREEQEDVGSKSKAPTPKTKVIEKSQVHGGDDYSPVASQKEEAVEESDDVIVQMNFKDESEDKKVI